MRGYPDDPEERFFCYVKRGQPPDKCWMWQGPRSHGYGLFRPIKGGQKNNAHIWSHQYWVGPIPEGYQVDHLCRVRLCVNPNHLEAVTPVVNVRRGFGWTEDETGWTCGRGHFLGPEPEGLCPHCQEMSRQRHRATYGNEKPTPGARRRALRKERERRLELFRSEYPDIPLTAIEECGLSTARRRTRAGWSHDGVRWVDESGEAMF